MRKDLMLMLLIFVAVALLILSMPHTEADKQAFRLWFFQGLSR